MTSSTEQILVALLATAGRAAFPVPALFELVGPTGKSSKQLKAFNLADGSRTQAEIGKAAQLDSGNLSRTVNKWLEEGIMFRLGSGRDATLLHIYPLPNKRPKDRTNG